MLFANAECGMLNYGWGFTPLVKERKKRCKTQAVFSARQWTEKRCKTQAVFSARQRTEKRCKTQARQGARGQPEGAYK